MRPAVELRDISKTFIERSWRTLLLRRPPVRTEALRGVTVSLEHGEIFGLLGPNGAGKTTLIKILATLILPDGGSGTVCGYDLRSQSSRVRHKIGLVNSSERSFYWRLTGRQNLKFFAMLYNLSGRRKNKRVDELLELTGLEEKADIPFMKYSDGQKQRLAIARALLPDPEILLMDEPTKSLDPIAAAGFINLTINELAFKKGKTVLWCTHNLKEAEEVCTRLAVIHRGRIIASGDFQHLRSLIGRESLYHMSVDNCPVERLREIGINPVRRVHNNGHLEFELTAHKQEIPLFIRALVEMGINVHACREKPVELNRVFERLVGKC
ncbi:MAG: ABC transporter ATP-binding protein [Deferribacteres bacterium]|nr:ABC transporter ATP-binding protein [Deferribacteres bacterium]